MDFSKRIELEYRALDHDERVGFSRGDLGVLLSLAFWGPVSWLAPTTSWAPIARWLAARKHEFSPRSAGRLKDILRSALELDDDAQLRALSETIDGGKYELRAQIMRLYRPGGWRPQIRLHGAAHLDEAAKNGRGAILWASHFVFGGTLIKMALAEHNYDLTHLSRPEHGFSKTAFGIRALNPIRCLPEDQLLKERIVIDRNDMPRTKRQIDRVLEENGILSITVGAWEGRSLADMPFLGHRLKIATGALNLGYRTGAPVLPVTAVSLSGSEVFEVTIGEPLPIPRDGSKHDAIAVAVAEYGRRLERDVRAFPGQWRAWNKLRPAFREGAAAGTASVRPNEDSA
jgi:lauroyl/myristoyl acyltransferase